MKPFKYKDGKTPEGYECADCGAKNVRLYREYQILRCRKCAIKDQKDGPSGIAEHNIGWLVAAVPTEDGETFWGYTSVPNDGGIIYLKRFKT